MAAVGDNLWSEDESEINDESENEEYKPVDILQWIKTQNFLPQNIDSQVLSFLGEISGENATKFVSNFYLTRLKCLKLFRHRHPRSEEFKKYSAVKVTSLSDPRSKAPEIVFAAWLTDEDLVKFCFFHLIKLVLTELDILLQEGNLTNKKVTIILDMALFTPKHVATVTRYTAYVISNVLLNAIPVPLASFLLINTSESASDFTQLFPAIDFRIVKEVEELPKFIPQELLPSDLAGYPGASGRDQFASLFIDRLMTYSGWLADVEKQWDSELYKYSTYDPEPAGKSKKQGKTKKN